MAIKLSTAVRNARINAIKATIGTSPVLNIYEGTPPATTTEPSTGTLLAQLALPSDWMTAADNGEAVLAGTWSDSSANATGTAGYFRLFATDGITCGMQGTITEPTDTGDLKLDNVSITSGQVVSISTFTVTDGDS